MTIGQDQKNAGPQTPRPSAMSVYVPVETLM